MSTQVIVTIVLGLVCVVFAFLKSDKRRLSLIVGIIGILLLTYGGFTYGALRPVPYAETFNVGNKLKVDYPIERVQVISPIDQDVVKCRILTMGVYPEGHEKDIWVVLKPTDGKYYPQSDHTNTSYKRKGEWQVVTRFGGDAGEAYDLIVYEANADASAFFSTTISDWKAANDYIGLQKDELPEGLTEVERLSVTLEDTCRGIH